MLKTGDFEVWNAVNGEEVFLPRIRVWLLVVVDAFRYYAELFLVRRLSLPCAV